jgi:hypothetical protein
MALKGGAVKKLEWFSRLLLCVLLVSLTWSIVYSHPAATLDVTDLQSSVLNRDQPQEPNELASSNVELVEGWPFGPDNAVEKLPFFPVG